MANKSSSYVLGLACFAIAIAVAGATQFTVGGANGWSVPAAAAEPFNTWAERTRFQIGDSLVFVYPKDQDSVLLVEPAEYNACNTSSYVKRFDDGDTTVPLDRAGAFFFISGVEPHCRANEKLIVMVLAAARNGTGGAPAPPATAMAPPSPPASAASPPPASSAAPPPPPPPPTTASPPPPASSAAAPPPAASAPPTTTPPTTPSSPAPAASTPPPPPATAGAPEPPPAPSASSPAPSARGRPANSTGTPPSRPAGSKDKNSAAVAVTSGLASAVGACVIGYAMLSL